MTGNRGTAFVNGAVFDGHRYLGAGPSCWSRDGRSRRRRDEPAVRGHESWTSPAGCVSPGFTDAHVHPIQGGLERLRCDLSELSTREEYLAAIRAYADRHPDRRVDPRRRLGDAGVPGRQPDRGRPRRGRARPAGVPAQPRPPRRVGQQRGRSRSPASTASTPDPPDGRIERDADGRPSGTLHEGATALVSRHLPRTSGEDYYAALMEGQRLPPLARRHGVAGRHRRRVLRHGRPRRDVREGRRERRPALARRGRAVVGAAARGRAGRGPRRPPRRAQRRAASGPRRSRSCRTAWPRTARPRC